MKTIAIFGAAREDIPDLYKINAHTIGTFIGEEGHILLSGAGPRGCMGAAISGFLTTSPHKITYGSSTELLARNEGVNPQVPTYIFPTLQGRDTIYYMADIIIMLQGGIGTYREFFHFLVEKSLGIWEGELWALKGDHIKDLNKLLGELMDKNLVDPNVANYYKTLSLEEIKKGLKGGADALH